MAAIAERFQGLRRPGASLLKKTLPSQPNEHVVARKAVPPPKVVVDQPTTAPTATPASSNSNTSGNNSLRQKTLPSLPASPRPPRPSPAPELAPAPSASSVSSLASGSTTITTPSYGEPPSQSQPVQSQSQFQSQPQSQFQSQPANNSVRPPRTTSLGNPEQDSAYPEKRPQHRQVENLQANQLLSPRARQPSQQPRPVSEAPSISQFIPDPEPEPELPDIEPELYLVPEEQKRFSESETSNEQNSLRNSNGAPSLNVKLPDGCIPPIPEQIVIPPLTNIHYRCYQSHTSMLITNNVWYATACMTCKKIDQEIRHRCTFCCLRICSRCFESLKKSKNRSLTELMATLEG